VNQCVCVHAWVCMCVLGVWGGEEWLMQGIFSPFMSIFFISCISFKINNLIDH